VWALRQRNRGNVYFVHLETLTEQPRLELQRITDGLNIEFEEAMLAAGSEQRLHGEEEAWKAGMERPIEVPANKFGELLTASEQDWVVRNLDWASYARLR